MQSKIGVKIGASITVCLVEITLSNRAPVRCSTLCDPYLNLFRGLIPPIGGTLDLSPILAFIVLDVRPLPLPWLHMFQTPPSYARSPAARNNFLHAIENVPHKPLLDNQRWLLERTCALSSNSSASVGAENKLCHLPEWESAKAEQPFCPAE